MKDEPTNEKKPTSKRKYVTYSVCAATLLLLFSVGAIAMNQGDSSTQEEKQPTEKKITMNNKKNSDQKKDSSQKNSTSKDPFERAVGLIQDGANYVFGTSEDGKSLFSDTKDLLNPLTALAEEDRAVKKEEEKPVIPPGVADHNKDNDFGSLLPEEPTKPIVPPVEISYPTITAEDVVIGVNSEFNPSEYASAKDIQDGSLNFKLRWDISELDTTKSGHYNVTYSVTNSHKLTTTKTITVIVNASPEIHLSRWILTLPVRSEFNPMDYVTATDTEDGDLTNSVIVNSNVNTQKAGFYSVEFTVYDKYGYSSTKKMIVIMKNELPVIHTEDCSIQIDKPFDPLNGVTASDKESGDLTESIKILENNVDVTKAGIYTVTYYVEDGNGGETTLVRTITVVNEAPVIHASDLEFPLNSKPLTIEKALEGVTVTDREDDENGRPIDISVDEAQLAAIDMTTAGTYELTYTATDSHGVTSTTTIKVVVTNGVPVIYGAGDIQIEEGSTFDPLNGVKATDKEDGDIELTLANVSGVVDTNLVGDYELTYTVTDSDGNVTEQVRRVTVTPKFEEEQPEESTEI